MKTLKIYKTEHHRVGYHEGDIKAEEFMEVCAEYNTAGQIVREERYNADGTVNTLTVNQYSDSELLVGTELFDHDHVLIEKVTNEYNDLRKIVCQKNCFGDSTKEYVTRYVYDKSWNLIRHEVYSGNELEYVEKTFEYDENGRLAKEIQNDEYGKAQYVNRYSYDERGLVVKFVHDEVQNKDRRTLEYEYDTAGNRTKELVYDYDNTLIAKTYYTYNEQNRLIQTEEEDLDNYRCIKMDYDGSLVVKNTILDKNGEINSWAEYTYDENGKQSAAKEYIRDEVSPESYRLLRETRYERIG